MKFWGSGVGLLIACGFGSFALAQGTESGRVETALPLINSTARSTLERGLNLIDLVLEHHIAPPTMQEMLLSGARSLLTAAKIQPTAELSRRASAISTRPECLAFLESVWQQTVAANVTASAAEQALKSGILQVIPGEVNLIPAKELKVQQQLQANQYVGIGIALSGRDGEFTMNLFPNGPADKAGAKTGDRIEAIDGKPTKGLKLTEVVDRLRGPEGSEVTLLLNRGEEQQTLTITRGVVPRETVFGRSRLDDRSPWNYQVDATHPIAYVRIGEVGGSSVHELRQIEQKLRAAGMKALIIDLQNERGLDDSHYAVMLADALLSGGKIGQIRRGERVKEFTADSDCLFANWPMAVLVNELTDGPAEWLAAALQDNHRAILVGTPTPGSAYLTQSFPVPDSDEAVIVPTGILERSTGQPLARPLSTPRPPIVRGIMQAHPASQPWGVKPNLYAGPQKVQTANTRPGPLVEAIPDPKSLPARKIVTIKADPVSKAVEHLCKELGISIQSNGQKASGN